MKWQRLGAVAPTALTPAREELHWATQVLAAAGETHLPHRPDTSHTAAVWLAEHGALAGFALEGGSRLALRFGDLSLLLLDGVGELRAAQPLAGLSLADACGWAAQALSGHGGALQRPDYDMPPHPIAEGGRFTAANGALAELGHWFANFHLALSELAAGRPESTPVLCWPHHFDIATLLELQRDEAGAATHTIGLGLSPGDVHLSEPYVYVNHWPEQNFAPAQPLSAGEWRREGWRGAQLRGAELVAAGSARAQQALLARFFDAAIAANRAALRSAP